MAIKKTAQGEQQFFAGIRELLTKGRETAYRSVNAVMVKTYWQIGKRIVEQEQHGKARAGYGEQLIIDLSRYLTDCFGKGFSEANLWNFKQFHLVFSDFEQFSTQCVGNLSWTNTRLIMRLDDEKERHYYLREASSQNWSSRFLERNIKSGYYQRLLSSQQSVAAEKADSFDFIKDPYVLEFLDVPEDLSHQDIGQIDMYVRMFDELKRGEGDNPTLGIILCADKDERMVKYSVLTESKQLFASKYKTVLPTEKELIKFIEQENLE